MNIIRHVVMHGRVQGVGFRAFVEDEALRRAIEGWVRNRRDGSVEAVFAGEPDAVAGVIEACGRGPLGAQVSAVHQREASAEDFKLGRPGELFSVLPTA